MRIPELSAPHNWCDRRCERCPLARQCPIPAAAERPLLEIVQEAAQLAEEAYVAAGFSLDDVPPPPPPSVDQQVLERAARDWAFALRDVLDDPARAVLVVGKIARVASEEELDDDELRAMDTYPNLLLLERTLEDLRADIERTSPPAGALAAFEERDRVLRGLLAPLFAAIPASERALIAMLAAAGRAPSPFAVCAATDARPAT